MRRRFTRSLFLLPATLALLAVSTAGCVTFARSTEGRDPAGVASVPQGPFSPEAFQLFLDLELELEKTVVGQQSLEYMENLLAARSTDLRGWAPPARRAEISVRPGAPGVIDKVVTKKWRLGAAKSYSLSWPLGKTRKLEKVAFVLEAMEREGKIVKIIPSYEWLPTSGPHEISTESLVGAVAAIGMTLILLP